MKTIRWGIIGCGDVTEIKSGPGFQKAAGSELVAVMRRDGAKAADYAKRHGVARWYDNADALILDREVDAVYVATPPGAHEECALKVCAVGKPCYLEKPMSRNAAEAQRMVRAFAVRELPLFVAYYRRGLPRFVKAKQIIDSGALGALHTVEYRYTDGQMRTRLNPVPWRLDAQISGGGLFLDLGSHVLDLLDWLVGPLGNVTGTAGNIARQYDVEDRVELTFSTPAGVRGSASWFFSDEKRGDEFRFAGNLGELRFSCFGGEPVRLRHADGREDTLDLPNPPHVGQPLIQLIVDELRDPAGAIKSPSTGISALRTQVVMDTALESYYGGREDGFWTRSLPKMDVRSSRDASS